MENFSFCAVSVIRAITLLFSLRQTNSGVNFSYSIFTDELNFEISSAQNGFD